MTRKHRGETIAETLISVLISAISLLLLVTMIQTSAKLISNSETALKNDTENINKLNHPGDTNDDGTTIGTAGRIVIQGLEDTGDSFQVSVKYVLDDSGTAVSYEKTP